MTISRRALLTSTALVPAALALDGCAALTGLVGSFPITLSVPAWTNAIQAIGQYLSQNVLPAVVSAGAAIPSSTLSTINTVISDISKAASGVNAATTQSQGAGVLATIENFVNQLAPIAETLLPLVPGVGPILSIAFAALPAIEGLVNMGSTLLSPLVTQIASAPAPAIPTAAAVRLTPAQALAIVLSETGRG